METPKVLDTNHPSFGSAEAYFLFASVGDGNTIEHLYLVEAKNSWGVQVLEKILLKDMKVNDKCACIGVFRDVRNAGLRSDLLKEIEFVDFMLDYVDTRRIMEEPVISYSFARALTPSERSYASMRLSADIKKLRQKERVQSAFPMPAFAEIK